MTVTECDIPKHRKRKNRSALPYAVEYRWQEKSIARRLFKDWDQWRVWKRYERQNQRDRAIEQMRRNQDHGAGGGMEFRIPPTEQP